MATSSKFGDDATPEGSASNDHPSKDKPQPKVGDLCQLPNGRFALVLDLIGSGDDQNVHVAYLEQTQTVPVSTLYKDDASA